MAGRARPQPQPQPHSPSASTRRREWWLVVLGVALHAVYMLSIFDIYFKSPIVHGMAPEPPRFSAPPAKRLVLLVADGLRADKFFEPDERGRYRAPFLRGVIEEKGRWGVSHARPPTESRPGHVAIIAGFYEDPSAVTKGWKANPVEFDSILFPYSAAAYLTVPGVLIPMNMKTLRQFQGLLNRSFEDAKLRQLLLQDKLVIFLHLLGCDTNGHAHRPYSNIYLNNVKVVDQIAESMYNLMESYFNDNQTAYATLVGLPCPLNSVGSLPTHYLKLSKADEVEAVLANTKQILNQFLRKSQMKQSSSLYFKPFKPLANYSLVLNQIEGLISAKDYENAMKNSEELRSMALAGLHYFQTYDWFMLMTTITLGYIGWMVNLILHVLQSYTSFPANLQKRTQVYAKNTSMKVYIVGCFIMGFSSIILLLEKSPLLYHAYLFMTIFLWTRIVQNFEFIKAVWRELSNMPFKYTMNLLNISVIALFILEFLVMSFFDRKLYTWCFLILGILASSFVAIFTQASSALAVYVWLSCWFLSLFTLMPAEIPENNNLVIFVAISSLMVWISTSHRSQNKQLHPLHQMINWLIAEQNGSARRSSVVEGSIFGYDERCLQLSDLRIPLLFTILFNVAFFGTGNFASIASFEISSVYRFITIFSPFLMAALLIFKLFIPFMLVICTFSAITKVVRIPRLGCYFLVRNTGSWMEIGNSISHFGIVSAQVVFVLLLFALTNIFTKDIEVSSRQLSSRKVM
uniref:GPI ethanolamine phosphate transferase 1 n=1 Tax=Oryza meridionalis TaxID=40149 RepID=A0A0E0CMG9_9ORYZ